MDMTVPDFDEWYKKRYNRTSSWIIATSMIIIDFLGVMASFGLGFFIVKIYYILNNDWGGINFKSFVTYWPYLPIFILIYLVMRLYPGVSLAPAEELRGFSIGSIMAHGGIIISRYIESETWDSISAAFIISAIFLPFIILTSRGIMHIILHKMGLRTIPAVIYGANETGRKVVDRLLKSTKAGYTPVLILDDDPAYGDDYSGIPIIHDTTIGPDLVRKHNLKIAIVAMPNLSQSKMSRMMNFSVSAFRYNVLIPEFFNVSNIWMSVRDFDGILGLAASNRLKIKWNLAIKRFLDILFVCVGGLILLPFLLIFALLVKVTSPGPVLYGHKRLGLGGKPFTAYKFRSMVMDADTLLEKLLTDDPELSKEWEMNHKLRNDPRITKIGQFLRRTSFDELPQLLNILKGDMSLVGPRPIVEAEIKKYGENYKRIFSVKPGLTGLWQISGRSDTNYAERISYDTYYLQSWSVWLDIWILYRTPRVILRGNGAY